LRANNANAATPINAGIAIAQVNPGMNPLPIGSGGL